MGSGWSQGGAGLLNSGYAAVGHSRGENGGESEKVRQECPRRKEAVTEGFYEARRRKMHLHS